jgi:hypothetical protein
MMNVQTWFKELFLGAAGVSFLLSVYLWFVTDNKDQGLFVGLWVPSILSLGNLLQPASRHS